MRAGSAEMGTEHLTLWCQTFCPLFAPGSKPGLMMVYTTCAAASRSIQLRAADGPQRRQRAPAWAEMIGGTLDATVSNDPPTIRPAAASRGGRWSTRPAAAGSALRRCAAAPRPGVAMLDKTFGARCPMFFERAPVDSRRRRKTP
jgi:hypothetical protein